MSSRGPTRRSVLVGVLVALLPSIAVAAGPPATADRIVVRKGARRLDLLRAGQVIRSYPIRLGANPAGPKVFQYDGRTPEGTYIIDGRSQVTAYHLALHISYPQPANAARAAKYGLPPGGGIFIHGTPGRGPRFDRDWTDGCIAVSNDAMDEIWKAVADGTPIDIQP